MDIRSELIESLEKCVTACNHCAASCLDEENVKAMADCIKLDLDCADVCQMTLKLLVRDNTSAITIVQFCSDICAECASECEKHEHDHCQQCAEACRNCEEKCKTYLDRVAEPNTV